jgi:cytochrome b561
MHVEESSNRGVFDQGTRVLHWLTAAFMLSVFVLAFLIDLATSRTAHIAFLQLHRLMGLAVWLVTLFRLLWRLNAKYPDWPSDMSETMRAMARTAEYALYVLLLLQPILGLLQTNAHGDRASLFFLGQLPALIEKNRPLAQQLLIAHKIVGFSLLGLIAVHAMAALFHHFVRRDDVLTAMLPAAAAWRTPKAARDITASPSLDSISAPDGIKLESRKSQRHVPTIRSSS